MTCIAPETRVLTSDGFLTAEETFARFESGARLRLLSFDARSMRPVWRDVIAAGKKPGEAITVSVSQTGRVDDYVLRMTADHKMMTFDKRRLTKVPLANVLEAEGFVTVVDDVPSLGATATSPALAYVAGAFVTGAMPAELRDAYDHVFARAFPSHATREGAVVRAADARLHVIADDTCAFVLSLDRTALLHFVAGSVDAGGTLLETRLTVDSNVPDALILACVRLGITAERANERTVLIAERLDELLAHTHRVRSEVPTRSRIERELAVRGLLDDLTDHVNFMGRVREGLKRNIMFGGDKIRRDILPLCPADAHRELTAILDAPVRSYRVKQTAQAEATTVYNFEVDATDEIDKCFVVFTSRMTPVLVSNSHAAVVARGMGKPCVAGCSALAVSYAEQTVTVTQYDDDGRPGEMVTLKKGDVITLDGGAGHVYAGAVPTVNAALTGEFAELMGWADSVRVMKVRANADTPLDARTARRFGAEGIGLCRTEHMFFDEERIRAVREMILADDVAGREKALAKLLPHQRQDFVEIFREMRGLPVTIRLLDPPLHEFLPSEKKQIDELAGIMNVRAAQLEQRIKDLHEFNPMLGHRGCRLAITYPEIYAMQVRAILEAAVAVSADGGTEAVHPEIMIPLAMTSEELQRMRGIVDQVAKDVFKNGKSVPYSFGTMIELPRAALRANDLAHVAEFFSFGTNDLTQCTMGLSRDDAGKFLPAYVETGILPKDPFVSIDVDGVGALVKLAVERGRATKQNIKLGVCGEHGGDPDSIKFFREAKLDYVSCSPFRVTIARLAAAQAEVAARKGRSSGSGTA
jgi:phosphohistidine swiveling domain-containing protein